VKSGCSVNSYIIIHYDKAWLKMPLRVPYQNKEDAIYDFYGISHDFSNKHATLRFDKHFLTIKNKNVSKIQLIYDTKEDSIETK
jgi:hypothetical protein